MFDEIHEYASAKINLNLKVYPRRLDGFHAIESIFQTVNLQDELIVSPAEGKMNCIVNCSSMVLPELNTLNLAYKAFSETTGIEIDSVVVELIKKIPSGGGLGGGSSDAAALVRALEKIYSIKLTYEQLDKIASKVGSDVFFFMHCDSASSSGCAVVTGRGENVFEICRRSDLNIVLVFPDVHSSTKEAYALIDEQFASANEDSEFWKIQNSGADLCDLEKVYKLPVWEWKFVNTFTTVLSRKYSDIQEAITELKAFNADFCDMSGSGSTVFGIFSAREAAENAVAGLKARNMNCVLVN